MLRASRLLSRCLASRYSTTSFGNIEAYHPHLVVQQNHVSLDRYGRRLYSSHGENTTPSESSPESQPQPQQQEQELVEDASLQGNPLSITPDEALLDRSTEIVNPQSLLETLIKAPEAADLVQSRQVYPFSNFEPELPTETKPVVPPKPHLPLVCPGCGALSQITNANDAGYYDVQRKSIKAYLGILPPRKIDPGVKVLAQQKDAVVQDVVERLGAEQLEALGLNPDDLFASAPDASSTGGSMQSPKHIYCNRCHDIQHYHRGTSIFHPSVFSLRETLEESPYKYNHVYHVIDAADFPMSLVPRLHELLGDIDLRSRNRRSRSGRYHRDRRIDMSFIVTRADLLAPQKEQVDRLMPKLREILRQALGRYGNSVRLGNLHCVSAQRGWWTTKVKESIWRHGGASWMIGKVNVGKSELFGVVFPKGRMASNLSNRRGSKIRSNMDHAPVNANTTPTIPGLPDATSTTTTNPVAEEGIEPETKEETYPPKRVDVDDWLPPPLPEEEYPPMPTVSELPGTTASPIRVPFGGGKGEVIDLPGLARSDLDTHVSPEYHRHLLMKKRIVPEQQTLKPGQSLLLGGFIRITPRTPGLIFLGYNFTPLPEHVTSTDKAQSIQAQTGQHHVLNIAQPGTGEKVKLAVSVPLQHDVTKERAGPLTRRDAVHLSVENLPFRVLSADIVIEGVGWVEIVAQVRSKDFRHLQRPVTRNTIATPYEGDQDHQQSRTERPIPLTTPNQETADQSSFSTWDDFETMADNKKGRLTAGSKSSSASFTNPSSTSTSLDSTSVNVRPQEEDLYSWPIVDIFTPEGKYVSSRPPLGGWLLNKPRILAKHKRSRPRPSMKGRKKQEKLMKRRERQ